MNEMPLWEAILLGLTALLVIVLFRPGVRAMVEQSRHARKDWPAFLIPIGLVVLFVIFLIALVR